MEYTEHTNIVYKGSIHWMRILLRFVFAFVLSALSMVIVAILRQHCTNVTPIIPLLFLVGINIHALYLVSKNRYSIKGDRLVVEENYLLRKRNMLSIPISAIDSCELSGMRPYLCIKISVHGYPYKLRNISDAANLVEAINNKLNA